MTGTRFCCCGGCKGLVSCGVSSDIVQFSTTGTTARDNSPPFSDVAKGLTLDVSTVSVTQTGGSITRFGGNEPGTTVDWDVSVSIDYTFASEWAGGFESDCSCVDGSTVTDLPAYSGTATITGKLRFVCSDDDPPLAPNTGSLNWSPQSAPSYDIGADYTDCDTGTTKPPVNGPYLALEFENRPSPYAPDIATCSEIVSDGYFDAEFSFAIQSTGDCKASAGTSEYNDPITLTMRLGFE
jgi:hypothetical protein